VTPEYHDRLHREFPQWPSECRWSVAKKFPKLIGLDRPAGAELQSMLGQQQDEQIVPTYAPEQACRQAALLQPPCLRGYGKGVLSRAIWPADENRRQPHHPGSLGARISHAASILDLWDPNRAQTIRQAGKLTGVHSCKPSTARWRQQSQ